MMTGDVNWGDIAGRGGFRLTMVVTKLRLAQLAVADCPMLPGRWPGLFLLHWMADGRGGSPRKALPTSYIDGSCSPIKKYVWGRKKLQLRNGHPVRAVPTRYRLSTSPVTSTSCFGSTLLVWIDGNCPCNQHKWLHAK